MSSFSDLKTYGLSRDQAWRMLPGWAQCELERRHDGRIPIASMIDAMSWPSPPARPKVDEELHWIAVDSASARRSACHLLRLIRTEPQHRAAYRVCLNRLRIEHSQLMRRRRHLLRRGDLSAVM